MDKGKRMTRNERGIYLGEWIREARFTGTETAKKGGFVALSFDDGPHPVNTLKVIEILEKNEIPATFFWIVENAIKLSRDNPKLFGRIVSEIKSNQHEVGLHAPNNHRPTIYSRFFGHFTRHELEVAKRTLERMMGTKVSLYRPHYVQLGSGVRHAKTLGMTTVLGNPFKFIKPDGEVHIQVKTLGQAEAGNIMVLHDGQDNFQGKNRILDVLPEGIRLLINKGLIPTSVSKVLEN